MTLAESADEVQSRSAHSLPRVSATGNTFDCRSIPSEPLRSAPLLGYVELARNLGGVTIKWVQGMAFTRHGVFLCGIVAFSAILSACSQSEADSLGGSNHAPTITGTPGTSVTQGATYSFTPTAADSDNDPLIFGIDAKPAWATFNTSTGEVSGTPAAGDVATYRGIVVWVSDGKSQTVLPAFDLTVSGASTTNRPPAISGTPAASVVAGAAYAFTPTASDPDGDTLTFSIRNRPAWASFSTTDGTLSGTPLAANAGTFADIDISVSDGQAAVGLPAFSIVVTPPASNTPPVISGTPMTSVAAGNAYAFVPTASDADGDTLTFGVTGLPVWASFNTATGRLSGTPPSTTRGTFSGIVISVSDGSATASLPAFSITVTAPTTNRPPVISGTPSTTATQGTAYSFQPTASDPDSDPLTFSIANRPTWATFSVSTGLLQGTPGASNVGTFSNIVISVSDGKASTPLPAFSITVASSNTPPVILGTPPTTATVETLYTFTPTASDANAGTTLTFSITNKPSWATFSTSNGRLQGTPAAANIGAFANITIKVTDGQDTAQLPAFTITVSAGPNRAPTISGSPGTTVVQGKSYAFTPTASDPDGDTLTFSIANKPAWAAFSTSTGALTGTPGASNVGATTGIVISVKDASLTASLPAFTLTVTTKPNNAPVISGSPTGTVVQGNAYAFTPTASDADGDPLTFSITNKPAWAAFSTSTGALSGTPTAGDVGTTAGVVITVSDGSLAASLPAFSATVQAIGLGSATLSWTAPTQNTDGSPLTNLAGFKIYWGPTAGTYPNTVTLNNPGLNTYVVENLASGTYFFAASALNSAGGESALTAAASKTIP